MKTSRKIILELRAWGWGAWFYGFEQMPEDVELPLPFTSDAPLATVAADMRKRFPTVDYVMFRYGTEGRLTHVAKP